MYNKEGSSVKECIDYTYDAGGNQVTEIENISGATTVNEYDVMNQLTKSVKTKSGETLYTQVNTYNDAGQRISKTDNGVTTYYYYQGDVLLYTTDADGNKTSQNIVGPQDNVIATIRYNNGQHAYFYNKDIRTSVTNVVDEAGNGVVSYRYDDYGTTTGYGDENFYNEICYTSGVYDELTGQYYLNARYYNPNTATFITQDTNRGDPNCYSTWNLYAYCGGNPINYVDPSGHSAIAVSVAGYYIISGVISIVATKELYDTVTGRRVVAYDNRYEINNTRKQSNNRSRTKKKAQNQAKRRIKNSGYKLKISWKDAGKSPGKGWQWKGKGKPGSNKGSWYNKKTRESLHPDLKHPKGKGIKSHWDYKAPNGKWYRIFKDGSVKLK